MSSTSRYHPYPRLDLQLQEEDHHTHSVYQSDTSLRDPTSHSSFHTTRPDMSRPQFNNTDRLGNNDPPAFTSLSRFWKDVLPHGSHPSLRPSLGHPLGSYGIEPRHITDSTVRTAQNSAIAESFAPHRATESQDYVGHYGSASNIAGILLPADLEPHSDIYNGGSEVVRVGEYAADGVHRRKLSFPESNIRGGIPPRIRRKPYSKLNTEDEPSLLVTGALVQLASPAHTQPRSSIPNALNPAIAAQFQTPETDNIQDESNTPAPPHEKERPGPTDNTGFTEESGGLVAPFQVASENCDSLLLVPSSSSTPPASIPRTRSSRLRQRPKPYEKLDQTSLVPRARRLPSKRTRRPKFGVEEAEPEETAASGVPLQSSQTPSDNQYTSNFPSSSAPAPEFSGRVLRNASKQKATSKPYDRLEAPKVKRRKAALSRMNVAAEASTSAQLQQVNEIDAEEQTGTDLLVRESSPSKLPSGDDHHSTSPNSSESASSEWLPESGPRRASTVQKSRATPDSSCRPDPRKFVAPEARPAKRRKSKKIDLTAEQKAEINKHVVFRGMGRPLTSKRGFQCLICFPIEIIDSHKTTKGSTERHIRTVHLEIRPYECEFCTEKFGQLSQLQTHRNGHTGEKPHICRRCGKDFGDPSGLSRHKFKHPEIIVPKRTRGSSYTKRKRPDTTQKQKRK